MSGPSAGGLPERIGRYRIERVLGRGAMGVIYKAHDPEIDRAVAVKLVRADLLDGADRAEYLARFRREAQAAGRCHHPNIVALYDYAMHGECPFLAMEYVEGANLAQAIEHGSPFRPDEAASIAGGILDALGYAHGLGIVHRDIKPANVLLPRDGGVKVADFGVSRLAGPGLTVDALAIGTPSYMSPEQCRGEPVDGRSDLFSVGVLLFELLAGRRPFPGQSFTEVVTRLLHDEPPDLQDQVSGALAAVVRRALEKRPADRFPDAAAMATALRRGRAELAGGDETVVQRPAMPRPMPPQPGAAGVSDEVLDTLRRQLARYLGPIAGQVVGSAARDAGSVEGLCDTLARRIASTDDRETFLRDARRERCIASAIGLASQASRRGAPVPAAIPPDAVARVQADLSQYIGPIARLLVGRALPACRTAEELRAVLARHIERTADRDRFLSGAVGKR